MKRHARIALWLVLLAGLSAHAPRPAAAAARAATPIDRPRNVVLMIPDGCGPATLAAARMVVGHPLALDGILVGAVMTRSSDARVTDSGAAATAFATGHKTYNGGISEDTLHRPLATVLEAAEAKGLATGLVATSRITHATPAAFASHVDERTSEDRIAAQMLDQGIEVLLGGGRSHFLPRAAGGARDDDRDLLAESRARGAEVVVDRDGLERAGREPAPRVSLHVGRSRAAAAAGAARPLIGLFAMDHMAFWIDQDSLAQPRLVEMTGVALERLARSPRGFFLMVEGSRIDHAAHEDDTPTTVREALEFDAAVEAALEFARRDGHTLVISCADHETGGLTLGRRIGGGSRSDLHPEELARVRASAARMADRMRAGAHPESVMREWAGVDSLGEDERQLARRRPRRPGPARLGDRRDRQPPRAHGLDHQRAHRGRRRPLRVRPRARAFRRPARQHRHRPRDRESARARPRCDDRAAANPAGAAFVRGGERRRASPLSVGQRGRRTNSTVTSSSNGALLP